MLSADPFFEEQATRTLAHMQFGGADLGECITTMARVPPSDFAAWHQEWLATADRVAAIADACAAAGRDVSAREAYLRAGNYYRTSYLTLYGAPVSAALKHAAARETECFREAASRMQPRLEEVRIPFEGTTLAGWFCPAPGATGRTRTLIATNGYDSTGPEMYFAFAVAANRRGWHCLLFDGPGQGRTFLEQGLVMRPDWENVVRPVVDWTIARPDVDAARIALTGWSFGGYLSLRAAGGEPRLAACVADPGLTGLRQPMEQTFASLPANVLADPLAADPAFFAPFEKAIEASPAMRWSFVQRAFWVHGVSSLAEYAAIARDYDTRATLASIRCPVFVAWEENDTRAATAQDVYDALRGPKVLARFLASEGAGDHTAIRARTLFHQRMFDWLDEVVP
jgi:pimeloyl-ACP methyl ester carboxylesterase